METAKGRSNGRSLPPFPVESAATGWSLSCPEGDITLPSCGLLVGRSRTCDLVLSDPDVSRRHLRVFQMQDSPWAIDLGSANGVLVDGDGATRTRLQAGSRLWLGSVELEVRQAPGELPAALRQAWSALVDSPASALRDLAGAVACSVRQDGTYDFLWAEVGQCLDDLGPLRRCLLEAALEAVAR